jgi:hypothetical protein
MSANLIAEPAYRYLPRPWLCPPKSGMRTNSAGCRASTRAIPSSGTRGRPRSQAKRAYLIDGADPQLAATASGILLANGLIDRDQHAAATVYAWADALTYSRP